MYKEYTQKRQKFVVFIAVSSEYRCITIRHRTQICQRLFGRIHLRTYPFPHLCFAGDGGIHHKLGVPAFTGSSLSDRGILVLDGHRLYRRVEPISETGFRYSEEPFPCFQDNRRIGSSLPCLYLPQSAGRCIRGLLGNIGIHRLDLSGMCRNLYLQPWPVAVSAACLGCLYPDMPAGYEMCIRDSCSAAGSYLILGMYGSVRGYEH